MSQPFAEHAVEYNDNNLTIIPCGKKQGKTALVKWQSYQNDTPSLATFDSWIKNFPSTNIGLLTGRLNGITVVDCDDPTISIGALQETYGETPLIVRTPKGGVHLYYKYNGEHSRNGFTPKIDVKADGGYVIGPYSLNPETGKTYEIIKGSLDDICRLPTSIHSLTRHMSCVDISKSTALSSPINSPQGVAEGDRNNFLFIKTKDFAVRAKTFDEIHHFAISINKQKNTPPLPEDEVIQTVKSVWKYKQENRLKISGQAYIQIDMIAFDVLIKKQKALALYMLLHKHHKNSRKNFTILHAQVAKIMGCERKTIPKSIDCLIEHKLIKRVHLSAGKGDGHKYEFC